MPQFEISRPDAPSRFVRAKSAEDAVRRAVADAEVALAVGDAEPGTGWQPVTVGDQPWGQVRPRDRMRFRRD